jgi:hypothetical protein
VTGRSEVRAMDWGMHAGVGERKDAGAEWGRRMRAELRVRVRRVVMVEEAGVGGTVFWIGRGLG